MKRTVIIALLLIVTSLCFAQKQKPKNLRYYDRKTLRFGYSLGFTTMDFSLHKSPVFFNADTVYAIDNKRLPGFHLGIVSEVHVLTYVDIRFLPGLSFGERNLRYLIYDENKNEFRVHDMRIESTFVDFPLLAKYSSARVNNYRAYIVGGLNYRLDLAAQKKIDAEQRPMIRLRRSDLYYDIGFGIDYFFEYFKFSTEIKLSSGLFNLVQYDNTEFTKSISRLNSRIISISLHFEGGKYDAVSNIMGKLLWWRK